MINLLLSLALATSVGVVSANIEPIDENIAVYEVEETEVSNNVQYVLEYDCITGISSERAITTSNNDETSEYRIEGNHCEVDPEFEDWTIIEEAYSELLVNGFDEELNNHNSNSRDIIGLDTRDFVNLKETYSDYAPFCLIFSHFDTNSDGEIDYISRGSGVMNGPDICLTAAHVIFDHNAQVWASQVVIYPAGHVNEDGSFVAPYGAHNPEYMIMGSFHTSPTPSNDWALLRTSTYLGISVGWYSSRYTTESLNNNMVYVVGYQNDPFLDIAWDYGYITQTYDYYFNHNCDTTPGTSGAPVLTHVGANNFGDVCGIHSGAHYVNGVATTNFACRMTQVIYDLVFETSNFW